MINGTIQTEKLSRPKGLINGVNEWKKKRTVLISNQNCNFKVHNTTQDKSKLMDQSILPG